MRGPLELDTCRDFIFTRGAQRRLAFRSSGGATSPVRPTRPVVVTADARASRLPSLELEPGFPVAVVMARRPSKLRGDGLQQPMRYAEILRLPFAYSSNRAGASSPYAGFLFASSSALIRSM